MRLQVITDREGRVIAAFQPPTEQPDDASEATLLGIGPAEPGHRLVEVEPPKGLDVTELTNWRVRSEGGQTRLVMEG